MNPTHEHPDRPKRLRVVCAWCLALMQEGDEPTSHGCCNACTARLVAEAEQYLKGAA